MGEYMFGVGAGCVSDDLEEQIDAIAREHGASFINARLPDGDRHWFTCENRGAPFDSQTADAVMDGLRSAGLLDDDGNFIEEEEGADW